MQKVLIALAAILIIGGGAFALTRGDDSDTPSNTNQTEQPATPSNDDEQSTPSEEATADGTITYTQDGFSPATLTVKSGDTITIRNESSQTIQFESDPHPAHTSNTELNIDTIRPGQSKSFTANRTGTFGYHDHLNPDATGTITVQ